MKVLKIIGSMIVVFIIGVVTILVIDTSNDDEKPVQKEEEKNYTVDIENQVATVTFDTDITVYDENDLYKQSAEKSSELASELFDSEDVQTVKVIFPMTFGSDGVKDAITLTFDKDILIGTDQPSDTFNSAVEYYIHPSIYKSIDVTGLEKGFSKVQ